MKKRRYCIRQRRDYTGTRICYEVYVKLPNYKDYPISVGGREPFTFWHEADAIADAERRAREDTKPAVYDETLNRYLS